MSDDYESGQILFRVYGIELDDLPETAFETSAGRYPYNGCNHEAHDAATVVMNELKSTDRFSWSDEITGVAMGFENDETRKETAFSVLEDLRESLREDNMDDEADVLNEAHYLIQEYGDDDE